MNKSKNNLLSFLIIILVIIGLALLFMSVSPDGGLMSTFIDYGLILTAVAILLTLFFAITNIFKDKKNLRKVMMGVVALLVILLISYFLSNGNAVYDAAGKVFDGSEGSVSKWVGTSINYSLVLLLVSGVLFFVDMVKNIIK